MDEWLDDIGLYRKNTALDGSCLFRAVAEQLMPANPINGHLCLRKMCCEFMKNNKSLYIDKVFTDFDEYLSSLATSKGWGSVLELDAISRIYKVDFKAFFGPEKPLKVTRNGYPKELLLCVTGDSFYDAVYTKSHVQNLGFCQSIVYKILYEEVFKLNDLDYAVNRMLHDKAARAQRERYLNQQCVNREEICFDSYLEDLGTTVNVRKVLDSGAILFPYKVAKALDPDIYRNIDFDNWVESQRGKPWLTHCLCSFPVTRRNNFWHGNGGPLRVGVKCHVRFEGQTLTGHIQELSPDRGPAVVFIEELSQKMTMAYDDLVALPRLSMKPEWSYSHKNQMINRFGQRNKEGTPDLRIIEQSRSRRLQRDCSSAQDSFADSEKSVISAEADSTSSQTSPSLKTTTHSLIRTPNYAWTVVDKLASVSITDDGSDLPFDDVPTLQFYYNMGIEYFHKGVYIPSEPGSEDCSYSTVGDTQLMVQVCQGAPLIQPPPMNTLGPTTPGHVNHPSPMLTDPMSPIMMGPPPIILTSPPAPVCPASPLIPRPTPASHAFPCTTPTMAPSPLDVQDSEAHIPRIQDTPIATREGRERGRGSRFTKPPRFQRLESANRAAGVQRNGELIHDDVQNPEISSCTPDVPLVPVAVVPPMQMTTSPASFMYHGNEGGETYMESPPFADYQPLVVEHQPVYMDAEGTYLVYPTVPYYYH